jgi:lipopolysaccharide/colanic/teichoic acid biosynthesis glycosyltransferase
VASLIYTIIRTLSVILFPLLVIVAIIIKLYDRGPIFYKQKRVTKDNKIFDLYKFRTMIVDAEKNIGPVLASERDPRITPIGRFLRASRIDEIPQLINVIKGDMSIVGPRPERPFFVEKFNEEVDEFKYRVFVKAGITGLAQILGKYSTDPENKAKYDLLYIRDYSLLLDIKIIFNTIKIMFIKDSSKGVAKDKELDEIFKELNLNAYEEFGATRIE